MPLRLSVCFRNLNVGEGQQCKKDMLYLTTASNCESIRLVFKASIWLSPLKEGSQLRNSPRITRGSFLIVSPVKRMLT